MSALADWLDARGAIVHEWYRHGATVEDIVRRLTCDEADVRGWLRSPAMPFPGSSRALAIVLRERVDELERALLQVEPEPAQAPPVPVASECRELAPKKADP